MKHIKQLLVFFLIINVFTSCEKEEVSYALDEISAPSNVNAHFDISQDEVGLVSLTPTAEGATLFEVYFGDTENETPVEVEPGETITHIYAEGEYNLRIVAVGLTGLTSEFVRVVTISMEAPVDLQAEVEISPTNPFEVTVTPSATNATVFDVYFTDADDEEPITIMVGDFATYEYAEAGDYTIRIVARGAGAATAEITKEVTITGASEPVKLPITFDDAIVNYVFTTFNGSSFEIVDNPDVSGVNDTASKVGAITNSGAAYEGGSFSLGTPVDFSGEDKTITMMFWSDVSVPVLLKFEGGVAGERQTEVVATHGGTGWELLSFNFATDAVKSYVDGDPENGQAFVPTGQYSTLVLFIDGPGTTAGTFYIDNVELTGEGTEEPEVEVATSLPINFESNETLSGVFEASQGVTGEPVSNPDQSGINTSETVYKFTKANGAAWYSGIFQIFPQNMNLTTDKTFTFKIWSPKAGINVRMQLEKEGGGGGATVSIDKTLTEANKWVELSYNFSGLIEDGAAYDKIVIFPNFDETGQPLGDGSVYYIDDLALSSGGEVATGGPTAFPINFETAATGGSSEWRVFEGETPPLDVVENPNTAGINSSAKVAKFVAPFPGANYAGTVTTLDTPFTLTEENSIVKIMVYKSVISDVGIKFESNAASTGEVKVANTKINEWEELTFDMSGKIGEPSSTNIDAIVVFPDFNARTQENVVYFDNITLSAASGGGNTTSGPTTAAASPTEADADVFSIFSDEYSNPAGVNYFPNWGQATTYDLIQVAGDDVVKYSNLNYQGIVIGENVDVTGYEFVHIDVWSSDYTSLPFFLISGNGEKKLTLNLVANQWNSIDIPLSDFTSQGLTVSDVKEFKFDVQPDSGGTIFIDNLYFHN